MNKRNLFLWSLYDFANSIVFINFVLYFAKWIVVDGGLSDFWYNALFAIATILLLFSAPVLAAYTDRLGKRKMFLNIATIGVAVSYGLCAWLALLGSSYMLRIALLFLAGQYFYQLAFVFFNPMIVDVADEKHRSRASGIGQFGNSLGQLSGLIITLPLAKISSLSPLLPAVGIFFLLALPMMIFFREGKHASPGASQETPLHHIKKEYVLFRKKILLFFSVSVASPLLIAFFFFNDALITITNNYSIYLQRVFEVSDMTKSLSLMGIIVMSAIGGIIAGWLGDRIGQLRILKIILVGRIIGLPLLAVTSNFIMFTVLTVFIGLFLGSIYTVTRAYLSNILTKEEMGYGFSFYTLTERFATLFGPLSRGAIIWFGGAKIISYRIAMGFMALFVIIGLVILIMRKPKKMFAVGG